MAQVEQSFRKWISLATTPPSKSPIEHLTAQKSLLQETLNSITSSTDIPAPTSSGIVRAVVASRFGTLQAGREQWDNDETAVSLSRDIRDLTILVALSALCLHIVLNIPSEDDDDNGSKKKEVTILGNRDEGFGLNTFLLELSEPLASEHQVSEDFWPVSIIILAWAVVLNSMEVEKRFPSPGYAPMEQEFARRALRQDAGVWDGLVELLEGQLMASPESRMESTDNEIKEETIRRKVVKDLMMGVTDLIRVENIIPQEGIHHVWNLLFSGGSPEASALLCEDYWLYDVQVDTRRAILTESSFPQNTTLIDLLISLSGQGNAEPYPQAELEVGPSFAVYDEFASLSSLTLPLGRIGEYRTTGNDESGRPIIKTARSLILPGGEVISAGTNGTISNSPNETRSVRLEAMVNGWPVLFETLRAASGVSRPEHHVASSDDRFIALSVFDLGIESSTYAVQSSGLKLLERILHPTVGLPRRFFETLSTGIESPSVAVLEIVLSILDKIREGGLPGEDVTVTHSALNIISHLLSLGESSTWTALRSSYFFGAFGKRKSIAASLIHLDAARGDHTITLAVLRLVGTIVTASSTTQLPDERIVRPALDLIYHSIWAQATGWRYNDGAKRYEIYTFLSTIFSAVLAHPLSPDGRSRSEPAELLYSIFVTTASSMTYRPLMEILTGGVDQAVRYMDRDRQTDAGLVVSAFENAISFFTVLLRNSFDIPSAALPKALMSTPIITPAGTRTHVIDHLFQTSVDPDLPASTRVRLFRLIRAFLFSTAADHQRPSLAALLRHADTTCSALGEYTSKGETKEIQALAWSLLGTIIPTQAGCAKFCIGQSETKLSGPLAKAVEELAKWKDLRKENPRALAAILNYCLSVIQSPSSTVVLPVLRAHATFSDDIFELATSAVPTPPTFLLSMRSEDFAGRITAYAHSVQARANAVLILASEISSLAESADDEAEKEKIVKLVIGLFRSGAKLAENTAAAAHTSCYPLLHEKQGQVLRSVGVSVEVLRTIAVYGEREHGLSYLYDGEPVFANDDLKQGQANFALDMLNLNWSMLDADIALTRAFGRLTDAAMHWTDGDAMTAEPALKAAVSLAEIIASEEQGGDIMLAIQEERLGLLRLMLELACSEDATNDRQQLLELCGSIRQILESSLFPPLASLHQKGLPALHRPLLRILFLVIQAISRLGAPMISIDSTIEAATAFTLDVADTVLDNLVSQKNAPWTYSEDLGSIVGVLCEVTRTPNAELWLDKVAEHNLVSRSLELITRTSIENNYVAPYIPSVLLLHLALASSPAFAERLAVSGILPSYSHNAIAIEAEQGRIESATPTPTPNTAHGAWCGMLMVVKALLSTLPPLSVANLARTEILPFMRVATPQILTCLSWNGEDPISAPALDEMELVTDIFYAIAQAIGPNESLLDQVQYPLIGLLKSIRGALAHPHTLSKSFVPSSEEERAALEEELVALDGVSDPHLLDYGSRPIIAGRVTRILGISRSAVLTLITLTSALEVLDSDDEFPDGLALETDEEIRSTLDDPIGILYDIFYQTTSILSRFPNNTSPSALSGRMVIEGLSESIAVLATSQIIYRLSQFPSQEIKGDDSMDIDVPKRRMSGGNTGGAAGGGGGGGGGKGVSPRRVLLDVAEDLGGAIPDDGSRLFEKLKSRLEVYYV